MAGQVGPQGRRQARLDLKIGPENIVKLERGRDTRRLLGEAPGGAEPVGGPQPVLLRAQEIAHPSDNEQTPGVGGGLRCVDRGPLERCPGLF